MGEFELIRLFFQRPARRADVGVGDDCALLRLNAGQRLAVSTDMLVQDRHFFADVPPRTLGHKALAVNLSDLAACGARPLGFTLALALPQADEAWLADFAQGLLALADAHQCELVGGDTTAGPLNVCITVLGEVPLQAGQALLRSGAQPGDDLYVSGHLGDAALSLRARQHGWRLPPTVAQRALQRLQCPTPRVALGMALRGVANSAIDLSDGLLGDLGHILHASGVGATIALQDAIDCIASYADWKSDKAQFDPQITPEVWAGLALAGGDDYELLFSAAPAQRDAVAAAAQASATPVRRIGRIDAEPGLRVLDAQGRAVATPWRGFDHFAQAAR
ncbi:MAG: thiamine-phosphate kinase [Rhodoferax sp.]